MRIKFLATGTAPDSYEFEGEKIIIDGTEYGLSVLEEGDKFEGLEGEHQLFIRDIQRIDGELHVVLCEKAPAGHWTGIDKWIDSEDYNPSESYIRERTPEEIKEVM